MSALSVLVTLKVNIEHGPLWLKVICNLGTKSSQIKSADLVRTGTLDFIVCLLSLFVNADNGFGSHFQSRSG